MLSKFVFALKKRIKQASLLLVHMNISVLIELTLGHLRYRLTDVPFQLGCRPDRVYRKNQFSTRTSFY